MSHNMGDRFSRQSIQVRRPVRLFLIGIFRLLKKKNVTNNQKNRHAIKQMETCDRIYNKNFIFATIDFMLEVFAIALQQNSINFRRDTGEVFIIQVSM